MEAEQGGRVVVSRTASNDIQMRELYIQVDDLPELTLVFGQTVELSLPHGEHVLIATNRLFTKREAFHLSNGHPVTFTVANVSGGCLWAPLYIIAGTGGYRVVLERA